MVGLGQRGKWVEGIAEWSKRNGQMHGRVDGRLDPLVETQGRKFQATNAFFQTVKCDFLREQDKPEKKSLMEEVTTEECFILRFRKEEVKEAAREPTRARSSGEVS